MHKVINYHNGLVNFEVPDHWVAEYDEDGGGTFYDADSDLGTLRLNVITAQAPVDAGGNFSRLALEHIQEAEPESIEELSENSCISKRIQRTKEEGTAITLYFWHLATHNEKGEVRMANFSFTIRTENENLPEQIEELNIVDQSIYGANVYSGYT